MSIKFFYNFCLKDDVMLSSDILSAVRRSYFSTFSRIRDKITIGSDTDFISYDYTIEREKPMRWMVKDAAGRTLEESMLGDNGRYYVVSYAGAAMKKRMLFSRLHTLLKVEYLNERTGEVEKSLEPRRASSGICILFSSKDFAEPSALYPYEPADDVREPLTAAFSDYDVAASTNDGLVLFLSDAQREKADALAEKIRKDLFEKEEEVFLRDNEAPLADRLNSKDFNVKRNLSSSIDITKAEVFIAEDEEKPEEIISVSPLEPQEDVPIPAEKDAKVAPETHPAPEMKIEPELPVETADEKVSADSPASSAPAADAPRSEDESVLPNVSAFANAVAALAAKKIQSAADDAPDKVISSESGTYRYYGDVDASGARDGYGRTVTPDGRLAYEGCYKADRRSGNGSYFYRDGSLCYSGDWDDNTRFGVGVGISSSDGSIHAGKWKDNKPVGDGARLSSDGTVKFVVRELSDGMTVLLNFMPDDSIIVSKYDEKGKKLGEAKKFLNDFFDI